MAESFTSDFKRFFGRGLAILLPTAVTLWLLWQAFGFIYANVAQPINKATRFGVLWAVPLALDEEELPDWFRVTPEELATARANLPTRATTTSDKELKRSLRAEYLAEFWKDHWYLNLTGLFIAIMLIYLAGVLLGNIAGRSIYQAVERLITRIPGFKQVYPHVKQVVDLILGDRKMAFSKVVLVEYPSKDIWTIGFLTGHSVRDIDDPAGGAVVSVFIPTSPTPFTGFTINVRDNAYKEMDMTIEEALRFVITAGVLTPDSPKPGEEPLPIPKPFLGPIADVSDHPDADPQRDAENKA
jgi:uncharacterized membrane protein